MHIPNELLDKDFIQRLLGQKMKSYEALVVEKYSKSYLKIIVIIKKNPNSTLMWQSLSISPNFFNIYIYF